MLDAEKKHPVDWAIKKWMFVTLYPFDCGYCSANLRYKLMQPNDEGLRKRVHELVSGPWHYGNDVCIFYCVVNVLGGNRGKLHR